MRAHSLLVLGASFLAACGGMQIGVGPSQVGMDEQPGLPMTLAHEPCDTSGPGAVHHDADRDGTHDTTSVIVEGRERCRAIDTNRDGKPDIFVYFDPNGGVRRQERDHNHDGTVDEVAHFREGIAERSERGANGRVDTWEYYDKGHPVKRLRDVNGNGRVDQIWTWLPHKKGCATVHTDHDHDGKSDHAADVCAAGAAASGSASAR